MSAPGVTIVLVEPQEPGNVGASARAMSNMGLSRLRLVRPVEYLLPPAYRMALGGREIIEKAEVYDDLAAAVADCRLVVGTTRREGAVRQGRVTPRTAACQLREDSGGERSAVVFGREDRGLTNGEIDLCHRLVTIPAVADNQSLNLAQAVLIVAYEIFLAADSDECAALVPEARKLAPHAKLEAMYAHMEQALLEIDYLDGSNPGRMMRGLRRIFDRAGLDEREVRAMRGIFHQMRWYARKGVNQ